MADDIRRRLACDRCHSQKLRCPRRPGEETCDRCRKARTSCIFSPFRQKKPPQGDQGSASVVTNSQVSAGTSQTECRDENISNSSKRKRVATPSETVDIDPNLSLDGPASALEQPDIDLLGVDWPSESLAQGQDFCANLSFEDFGTESQIPSMSLEFNSFMPNSPQWQQPKQNGFIPLQQEPTPVLETSNLCIPQTPRPQFKSWDPLFPNNDRSRNVNTFTQETISQLVRLLSDLSVRIYDHSTLMPPQSIHDPVPADGDMISLQKYSKYSMDELFQLTQDLIDVYPSFLDALFGTQVSSASTPSSMTDSCGASNDTDISTPPDPTPRAGTVRAPRGGSRITPPDQSSILLILSVHLRLIGVYEELFKHMAVCVNHKGEMPTPGQIEINLAAPQLRMGSYKPPPSSAIPMAMLLFVQFSSQLSNYATELDTEIQESGACGPHSTGAKNSPYTILRAAAEDVKKRAKNMADELCRVRSLMLNSGLLA